MKEILLSMLMVIYLGIKPAMAFSGCQRIALTYNKRGEIPNKSQRTPIHIPILYYDGESLFFEEPHSAFYLQLINNKNIVIYETFIDETTTSIALPQNEVGNITITLSTIDGYYFTGEIYNIN